MGTLIKLGNNISAAAARVVFQQTSDFQCVLQIVLKCASRSQTAADLGVDMIDSLITQSNLNPSAVTAQFSGTNPSDLVITMTVDSKKPGTGPFNLPIVTKAVSSRSVKAVSKKKAAKKAAPKKAAPKKAAPKKAAPKKAAPAKKKAAKSAKKKNR